MEWRQVQLSYGFFVSGVARALKVLLEDLPGAEDSAKTPYTSIFLDTG